MNAVLDPKIAPAASQTFDEITQHLTALSEASSGCQQVLAQSQILREWTSERLREGLNRARPQTGLDVSNPDAIFYTRRTESGSIASVGMTDLLIDTLRNGSALPSITDVGFYTRHGTLERNHALTGTQNRSIISVLTALMPTLFSGYEGYLRGLWTKMIPHPEDPLRIEPADHILIDLQRKTLTHEIALRMLCRAMSVPELNRLSSVIAGDSVAGLYEVAFEKRQRGIPLLSTYVVSQSGQPSDDPSGVVFLVMPHRGIERFESIGVLREALSRRFSTDSQDAHLVAALCLSDRGQLLTTDTLAPEGWRFAAVTRPMLDHHMQSVKSKAAQDFAFLLEQKAVASAAWHEQVEHVQLSAYLNDAMGHRFNLLSVMTEAFVAPHWRKYAKPSDKTHLLALESKHRASKGRLASRLAGVESFTVFAHRELMAYIQEHLGCLIDPSKVVITLNDTIALGHGDTLATQYAKTLFEFAVDGLPDTGKPLSFAPAANHLHTEFSEAFVRTMLSKLNLHHRYGIALRQAYEDPETVRQMVIHRDSALALSSFTAGLRGHLIQDRSHELLRMIRGDQRQEGSKYSIGSLYLLESHTRFNDLIVFEEKTQSGTHYVLYAPGAPNGQDFFEYRTWQQLCFGVGAWLATEAGRSYVHDQLSGPTEHGHAAILNNVHLKPSLWGLNSCLFVRCMGETFQANMADLVSQKVSRAVLAAEMAAPHTDSQTSFASPSIQALMDARIEALNGEFKSISTGLVDYRSYVHQYTTQVLNEFLRQNGFDRSIDPDTLYFGLGQPRQETPDFGEHSELHQLTDLMMAGSEDILSHRPQIHLYVSTGLDYRELPIKLTHFIDKQVRGADLGAKYMDFIESSFLGRKSPQYARRKRLMAKRIQYQMSRGALKEFMRGQLSETQYAWLRRTVISLDQGASVHNLTSAVSAFRIANQIIEGVYIFRDFAKTDPDFNLLYTPNAPDGVEFRRLSDYAQLLESSPMQNYYYSRVAYMGQPQVGSFFERLERGGKFDEKFIRIVNRIESRIPDAELIYGNMIERMIADVDAQTESLAEARFATAWTVIQWLGNVLLVPFPAVSIAWGIFTSAVKVYQGIDAYLSGDRAAALPLLLEGVMGLLKGGNAARKLFNAAQLAAKGVGVPVGVWVWHNLEFEGKLQDAVNEYLRGTAESLIFE
ncbi:dermonecrotic toxin domain-containing protein [Pseudomonas sp. SLFW]|uniref:dermonecrotic toxin domain-containing protein n=1 Tax=Pseudomonas sp. SLFW TaxID=2683259 RepID=UPI0014136159|nr:DUF6543 domain-containing protein [Pseudomonas sp. SLFW]NBB12079.1 hypothetical protein [Pseudomonas sp. SLFW]